MENANQSLTTKSGLSKTQSIILIFFTYALIGWFLETAYATIALGGFHKRGFLFGPICPIYGFGAIILLQFLSPYKEKSIKLFFLAALVFSVFEFIVSFALDALFAAKWWDYSNEIFNINGRISLSFAIVWGIVAIIFIHFIHPFVGKILDKILAKIPYWIKSNIGYILIVILVVDTVFSSIRYLIV